MLLSLIYQGLTWACPCFALLINVSRAGSSLLRSLSLLILAVWKLSLIYPIYGVWSRLIFLLMLAVLLLPYWCLLTWACPCFVLLIVSDLSLSMFCPTDGVRPDCPLFALLMLADSARHIIWREQPYCSHTGYLNPNPCKQSIE